MTKGHAVNTDASDGTAGRGGGMRIRSSNDPLGVPGGTKAESTRFGSVVLEHEPVGEGEVERNVERGRSAMTRMGMALSAPGVRLDVVRGVPLYHADPQHPDRIVRVLDGHRQSGLLIDGEFKAV